MAQRPLVTLNTTGPTLDVPQAGDTYIAETDLAVSGNISVTGTVDGRDVATDGSKLDGIEAAADVTDAANVNTAGAVMESDYDAQTVLAATLDNTPAALTVAEQTVVGRITGGNVAALTATQLRTLINVEDGATADQTASEIMTAIQTVDGAASGLDADLLDGNEATAFAAAVHAHSYLANVVEDLTPELGGDLSVNAKKIVSTSNGNIDIEPHGTGNVLLGNFTFNADQTVGAGQDNMVMTYDHGTGLINLEAPAGGTEPFYGTIYIETVANQDYELSFDMPFGGTVTTLRTKSQSGTCTVTGKIGTTALGGTANSASSVASEQAHSTSNTFSKGDTLKITVSANAACLDLEVAFMGTQT